MNGELSVRTSTGYIMNFYFLLTRCHISQRPALSLFVLTLFSLFLSSFFIGYFFLIWYIRNHTEKSFVCLCLCLSEPVLLGACRSGAVVAVCFWPHHAICSNDAQASIKVGTPRGSWGALGSGTVALVRFFFFLLSPSLLEARRGNEKQNLKKSKTKQQRKKKPPS